MNAIRVKTHLTSDTVQIPELKDLIGKDVEIIVLEESRTAPAASTMDKSDKKRYRLRGALLRYDDPFGPAVPDTDWEVYS